MRRPPIIALSCLLAIGCGSDGTTSPTPPPPPPPPPPAAVANVTMTPGQVELEVGKTVQLTAQPRDADGQPLDREIVWSSVAAPVASVSASGLVTAVSVGSTEIRATSEGKTGTTQVTVVPKSVALVEVTPGSASLAAGETTQLTATLKASDGEVLTGPVIAWSSSDEAVASVSDQGLVTAVSGGGPVTITATASGKSGTATITVTGPPPLVYFTSGYYHTCGLTSDGTAYCWGSNNYDQLGTGNPAGAIPYPEKVNTSLKFTTLAATWAATCGLTGDGSAWCWGTGSDGELGNGTWGTSVSPMQVSGGHSFATILAGDATVCGVTPQGMGYCWGSGYDGELGNGTYDDSNVPVQIAGGHVWREVSPGAGFTCGVTTSGIAMCWGWGSDGELGDGGVTPYTHTPVPVSGGHQFVSVRSTENHVCALKASGEAWCWGWNGHGQLGNGSTEDADVPVQVAGAHTFVSIHPSGWTTCGLRASGQALCWGSNTDGEAGLGTWTDQLTPVDVVGGHSFTMLSQGLGYHFCGHSNDGSFCWGWNEDGQLGNGSYVSSNTPVRPMDLPTLMSVSAKPVPPTSPPGDGRSHGRSPR